MPVENRGKCARILLNDAGNAVVDNRCFAEAEKLIKAYYNGSCVDFSGVPVILENKTDFAEKVLITLRDSVKYGQTITYGKLAEKAGYPGAARAVGSVLANNPIPLIIPCHRVLCANNKLGGFSAQGGINTKRAMLSIENPKF